MDRECVGERPRDERLPGGALPVEPDEHHHQERWNEPREQPAEIEPPLAHTQGKGKDTREDEHRPAERSHHRTLARRSLTRSLGRLERSPQPPFFALHHAGLCVLLVVVPDEVEQAVHDQASNPLVE